MSTGHRKDMKALVGAARKAGATVTRDGAGHYKVVFKGRALHLSYSPGTHRSIIISKRKLNDLLGEK